jgi:hypothetical protein
MKLLGIISVYLKVMEQLPIKYSAFVRYQRKSEGLMGQYINYL